MVLSSVPTQTTSRSPDARLESVDTDAVDDVPELDVA